MTTVFISLPYLFLEGNSIKLFPPSTDQVIHSISILPLLLHPKCDKKMHFEENGAYPNPCSLKNLCQLLIKKKKHVPAASMDQYNF